jgi:alcohol dehydrogenase class IV
LLRRGQAVRLAAALRLKSAADFGDVAHDALLVAGLQTTPQVAVPTTLAGAEFTHMAGVTDPATTQKQILGGPGFGPRVVVLDPALTATTPSDVWQLGALKVMSDAIEILTPPELSPPLGPLAAEAVRLICSELRRSIGHRRRQTCAPRERLLHRADSVGRCRSILADGPGGGLWGLCCR